MDIDCKKQIEIALLAGGVAKAAIALMKLQHADIIRLSFTALTEQFRELEKAIPKKDSR